MTRRGLATSLAAFALVALVMTALFVPVPYTLLTPGPVCDTLGRPTSSCSVLAGGSLIQVTPASYASHAPDALALVTVYEQDGVPLWRALRGWASGSDAVVPTALLRAPGQSAATQRQQAVDDMRMSQNAAVVAALAHLGYNDVRVVQVKPATPAAAAGFAAGDVITAVDGTAVRVSEDVTAAVQQDTALRPLQLTVRRGGHRRTVTATPRPGPNGSGGTAPQLGLGLDNLQNTVHVTITLDPDRIGGPSAGLMLTLGILDRLSPHGLTNGAFVAGTGTIDDRGDVGPIGGIQQKLPAAARAGARVFLAPADNCTETHGVTPHGLTVLRVATLDDALRALSGVARGSLAGLPTC